jgi:thioredoxin-like negative regulator of GroEL
MDDSEVLMFKGKLLCCAVFALLISCVVAIEARADFPEWNHQFPAALELAKKSGKPILMDFQASWCPPCREMDKDVWPDQQLVEQSKKFVCISIDADQNKEILAKYNVRILPTILFADSWGNKLTMHEGYMHALQIKQIMAAFPSDFSALREWNEILADDDKNPEALYQVGEFYRRNNMPDLGVLYLKQALKTKTAETDRPMREKILLGTGLTYMRWKKFKDAQKCFEQCLKEIPDGAQADKALLGVLAAQVQMGKVSDAEKTFEILKARFPNSSAVQMAEQNIEQARKNQK